MCTLARQLKQYIKVSHSTGFDLFLRLGDSSVAEVLFTEVPAFHARFSGIQELLLPDILRWE
jgi:hypothetical protein